MMEWQGNLLLLDSGNALFANAGVATDADKKRATFVFQVMEELGYRVMAVGQRDLSAGTAFLEGLAKGKKVKLLSANLQRDGKRIFDASVLIDVKGVKVGIIGLSAPGPLAPNEPKVVAAPTMDALKAALAELGPRDVTVVLAATSYADAMQLSTEAKAVDFVIQSGEFRGTVPPQRLSDTSAVLLASGQKGQAMAKLDLSLGNGKGAFVDLSIADRDRQQADFVGEQIKTLKERLKLAKDKEGIAQLKLTLGDFQKRQAELNAAANKKSGDVKRFNFEWKVLGSDVVDDPGLKARVLEIDPGYSGTH
jgi:2',3'-cyclic-nucleotide 2'-phosphodiesterase (5'-nucleotidase family)